VRRLALVGAAVIAGINPAATSAQTTPPAAREARGYWWYEPPPAPPAPDDDKEVVAKPEIPPMAVLATWSPPRIAKLITQQRDYAATVLTVDAVADFWRLQDFARRKARAFAGVTQLALLLHPELNAKAANPMIGEARDVLGAHKDEVRRQYLRARSSEFALVMFGRTTCGYCRVQWPIVQRFQDEMGWQTSQIDLDRRPDLGSRFGVEVTPTIMVIRRNSAQRMVIAAGVETYPNLAQAAYQAAKLLSGDIRPEQWLTGAGEEDGFFDALANGPVSSVDPRTTGESRVSGTEARR
jgi:conjugal transfer pilus assembly protein TraF